MVTFHILWVWVSFRLSEGISLFSSNEVTNRLVFNRLLISLTSAREIWMLQTRFLTDANGKSKQATSVWESRQLKHLIKLQLSSRGSLWSHYDIRELSSELCEVTTKLLYELFKCLYVLYLKSTASSTISFSEHKYITQPTAYLNSFNQWELYASENCELSMKYEYKYRIFENIITVKMYLDRL